MIVVLSNESESERKVTRATVECPRKQPEKSRVRAQEAYRR